MAGPEQQRLTNPIERAAAFLRELLVGDERFGVTGASGWFGRTSLDILARTLGDEFDDRVAAFSGTTPEVTLLDGRTVSCRPLPELLTQDPPPTHLLHFACITRDRVADMGVGPYLQANLEITTTLIDAVARHRPRGLFFTSSGAVYASEGGLSADVAGNPYGVLKRVDELALKAAVGEVGGQTVTVRVFSVSGPYMTKPGIYALGDLIAQVRAGGPIAVRAPGPVRRSYVAAAEVVAVGVGALLDPRAHADLMLDSGGEVVEVGELARRVCEVLGYSPDQITRDWDPEAPANDYFGDSRHMDELAREMGLALSSLRDQIAVTAEGLTQSR